MSPRHGCSQQRAPAQGGSAPLWRPQQRERMSGAREGPASQRVCGQRQALGCCPKGPKRRGQSPSVQRADWTLVACAFHLWGVGVTCQAPRIEGGTLEPAPASSPACPVPRPAWHLGRWTGSIWGPWGTPGAGGAREVGGFSAWMTGCPPKPKLNVCLFPASLSPAESARVYGEFPRGRDHRTFSQGLQVKFR